MQFLWTNPALKGPLEIWKRSQCRRSQTSASSTGFRAAVAAASIASPASAVKTGYVGPMGRCAVFS